MVNEVTTICFNILNHIDRNPISIDNKKSNSNKQGGLQKLNDKKCIQENHTNFLNFFVGHEEVYFGSCY